MIASADMLAENENLIAWSFAYPCNDVYISAWTMYFMVLAYLEYRIGT